MNTAEIATRRRKNCFEHGDQQSQTGSIVSWRRSPHVRRHEVEELLRGLPVRIGFSKRKTVASLLLCLVDFRESPQDARRREVMACLPRLQGYRALGESEGIIRVAHLCSRFGEQAVRWREVAVE